MPKSVTNKTRPVTMAQEEELGKETKEEEPEVVEGTPEADKEGNSLQVNIEEVD